MVSLRCHKPTSTLCSGGPQEPVLSCNFGTHFQFFTTFTPPLDITHRVSSHCITSISAATTPHVHEGTGATILPAFPGLWPTLSHWVYGVVAELISFSHQLAHKRGKRDGSIITFGPQHTADCTQQPAAAVCNATLLPLSAGEAGELFRGHGMARQPGMTFKARQKPSSAQLM